jgi:hypothetical protein
MRFTRRGKTKQKHNTICVGHHFMQTNTNNITFINIPCMFPGCFGLTVLLIFLVVCVVQLCVFTFSVPCCEVRYDFRIKTMIGSSLRAIVCKKGQKDKQRYTKHTHKTLVAIGDKSWMRKEPDCDYYKRNISVVISLTKERTEHYKIISPRTFY